MDLWPDWTAHMALLCVSGDFCRVVDNVNWMKVSRVFGREWKHFDNMPSCLFLPEMPDVNNKKP